jgi:hypothetical protein
MRAGAIPLLAWGALLAVLMVINWIWTGDAIQVGTFAFAVAAVWGIASVLTVRRRDALRPGPPPPPAEPQAVPTASLGAVLVGVSVASIVFGLAFGRFLIYFGAALLIVSAALVARELHDERRERRGLIKRQETR